MKLTSFVAVFVLCAGLVPTYALGSESPEEVVRLYYRHVTDGRLEEAVTLYDEAALSELREILVPALSSKESEILRARLLGRNVTGEWVKNASGADIMIRMMGTFETQNFKMASVDVIGSVPEGADMVHVVLRATVDAKNVRVAQMDVMSLKNREGKWRMLLPANIKGLASLIKGRR